MYSFPYTSQITYDAQGVPIYDRPSNAEEQRKLNKTLYANGVDMRVASALQTVAGTGMTVVVLPGILHIEGVFGFETTPRTLTIQASQSLDRIDRIVARVDFNTAVRTLDLYVVTGVAAAPPAAPPLTRTTSVYEIALADIFIAKNTATITTQRITDLRLHDALCGTFTNAFGTIDYTPYFTQVQAMVSDIETEIANIKQGSAVMLKSVYGGKTADSVKKADAATTALACTGNAASATTAEKCTGNAATVGDGSTLKWTGPDLTTATHLAAWEVVNNVARVRAIAPANVSVGNAASAGRLLGYTRGAIYANWDSPVANAVNFKVDNTENLPVAKALTCTGHAAADAYAPVFTTGGVLLESTWSEFEYPVGCNADNCVVLAAFESPKMQCPCRIEFAPGCIKAHVYSGIRPERLLMQRYQ